MVIGLIVCLIVLLSVITALGLIIFILVLFLITSFHSHHLLTFLLFSKINVIYNILTSSLLKEGGLIDG